MANLEWVDRIIERTAAVNCSTPVQEMNELAIPRKLMPSSSTMELTGISTFANVRIARENWDCSDSEYISFNICHSIDRFAQAEKKEWVSLSGGFNPTAHQYQTLWMLCAFLCAVGPLNVVIAAYEPIWRHGQPLIAYWLPKTITRASYPLLAIVHQEGHTPAHELYRRLAMPLLSER